MFWLMLESAAIFVPERACRAPVLCHNCRSPGEGAAVALEHLVECGDRRAGAPGVGPDGADDGEEVGPGLDQGAAIFLRDAADSTTRHDRRLAPVADQLGVGVVLGGLGRAREEGAEGDAVGTGFGGGDGAGTAPTP